MIYILLILGFVCLIKGADFFVDGCSALARRFHVSAMVIGLTVVAMGTSLPELAISVSAAIRGIDGMAVSNIIGSNIFNLLMVCGCCAAAAPLSVQENCIKKQMPLTIAVTVLLLGLGCTGMTVGRLDGLILLVIFLAFLVSTVRSAQATGREPGKEGEREPGKDENRGLEKEIEKESGKEEEKKSGKAKESRLEKEIEKESGKEEEKKSGKAKESRLEKEKKRRSEKEEEKKSGKAKERRPGKEEERKPGETKERKPGRVKEREPAGFSWWRCLLCLIGGAAAIAAGGQLVVNSAETIASNFGLSDTLIGLTVCAIGTSLPELVTSLTATRKGEDDMAVGNVIGSCLFNVLMILGITAAIRPVAFSFENIIDLLLLIAISLMVLLMTMRRRQMNRACGGVCIAVYAVYMVYICMR